MIRGFLGATVAIAVALAPSIASAQPQDTLLLLPERTPPRVRDALALELGLAGHRVAVRSASIASDDDAARALAWHSGARTMLWLRTETPPPAVVIVRLERGQRWTERIEGELATVPPRAVALTAAELIAAPLRLAPPFSTALHESSARPFATAAARRAIEGAAPAQRALPREERVAWMLFSGGLAGTVLATLGGLSAVALTAEPEPVWMFGVAIGATVGATAGVLLAGRLLANGDPIWTMLAGLLGGAVSAGLLAIDVATGSGPNDGVEFAFSFLGTFLSATLPLGLATLAFELTVP